MRIQISQHNNRYMAKIDRIKGTIILDKNNMYEFTEYHKKYIMIHDFAHMRHHEYVEWIKRPHHKTDNSKPQKRTISSDNGQ